MATSKPRSTKGRAVLCARLAQEKQGRDLLLLDLTKIDSSPADFFVVISVDSEAQLKAVADHIDASVKQIGLGSPRAEGRGTSTWVILDYFDIVVHVMVAATREFYKLERLWGDAKAYTLNESGAAVAAPKTSKRTATP